MKTEQSQRTPMSIALLVAVIGCTFATGCEDGDHSPYVHVGNYSASRISVVIDGVNVGDLGPREERNFDVAEGGHTVRLLRGDGSPVFEDSVTLEDGYLATYTVRSDESLPPPPYVWSTSWPVDIHI